MNAHIPRHASSPAGSGKSLRVGFVGKDPRAPDAGGGEVQMKKTAEAIARLGVEVVRIGEAKDLRKVDLVHCFGSRPEYVELVEAARRIGVPSVVSTIAWFDLVSYWNDAESLPGKLSAAGKFLARMACPRLPSWRRRLYRAADLVLPNSRAEVRQLTRLFHTSNDSIRVVPNAADLHFADATEEPFVERFGMSRFILCPGRIEPRKNQLTLIRALKAESTPPGNPGTRRAGTRGVRREVPE